MRSPGLSFKKFEWFQGFERFAEGYRIAPNRSYQNHSNHLEPP